MRTSLLVLAIVAVGCSTTPTVGQSKLNAEEFKKQLEATGKPQLLDVRTPQEYNNGHLANAQNLNIYDDDFNQKLDLLSKDDTIFVYCKAGGRSAEAASRLSSKGFKYVYDLDGGMLKWEHAKFPVKGAAPIDYHSGLTAPIYDSVVGSQQLVVVDFYAEWCGPCKLMTPYLEKMKSEFPEEKLKIVKIDVDRNKALAEHFVISSIPAIKIYHKGKMVHDKIGLITEPEMMELIKPYL